MSKETGSCCHSPLPSKQPQENLSTKQQKARLSADQLRDRFVTAGVFGLLLFSVSMFNLQPAVATAAGQGYWFAIGMFTLAMMGYAGGHIYADAWEQLLAGKSNMNTLIALGTGSAWLFSMCVVLFPASVPILAQSLYFETSVMILAFVNFGASKKMQACQDASLDLKGLLQLQKKEAMVLQNGTFIKTSLSKVKVGDRILIRPGEKIPTDGIVVSKDEFHIDESLLTGESKPVRKSKDSEVFCGTCNGKSGRFELTVTKVGKGTMLASIIDLVENAEKPPIEERADKIASYFVPAVVVSTVLTALMWYLFGPTPQISYMLATSMSMLMISCPCTLGIAVQLSNQVARSKATEYFCYITNTEALERGSNINTVVLDKTGTITEGQPTLTEICTIGAYTKSDLCQLAASVEQNSKHPLAQVMIDAAKNETRTLLNTTDFKNFPGQGVRGIVNNHKVLIGNKSLMLDKLENKNAINYFSEKAKKVASQGGTPIYIAVNGSLAGLIVVKDPIKKDVKHAVDRLKARGIRVHMLTGDNKLTAEFVAKEVGIDIQNVIAEALPKDKLKRIEELQKEKETYVAMVGDGINDTAALKKADVGFAVAKGSDAAKDCADVILTRNSINDVADMLLLSKATMRNINQNFAAAFIYNCLAIPIAAGALYPFMGILLNPMIAGMAMVLSSLTVVANASRLKSFKIDNTANTQVANMPAGDATFNNVQQISQQNLVNQVECAEQSTPQCCQSLGGANLRLHKC